MVQKKIQKYVKGRMNGRKDAHFFLLPTQRPLKEQYLSQAIPTILVRRLIVITRNEGGGPVGVQQDGLLKPIRGLVYKSRPWGTHLVGQNGIATSKNMRNELLYKF